MTLPEFIATVVATLAWPVCLVTVCIILRRELDKQKAERR